MSNVHVNDTKKATEKSSHGEIHWHYFRDAWYIAFIFAQYQGGRERLLNLESRQGCSLYLLTTKSCGNGKQLQAQKEENHGSDSKETKKRLFPPFCEETQKCLQGDFLSPKTHFWVTLGVKMSLFSHFLVTFESLHEKEKKSLFSLFWVRLMISSFWACSCFQFPQTKRREAAWFRVCWVGCGGRGAKSVVKRKLSCFNLFSKEKSAWWLSEPTMLLQWVNIPLSGPVSCDTPRLSQRYPRLWGFWCLNMANWVRSPLPLFWAFPPWRACEVEVRYPPPTKEVCQRYFRDTLWKQGKTRVISPLCDTISKGYCAIWRCISHRAAKISPCFQEIAGFLSSCNEGARENEGKWK